MGACSTRQEVILSNKEQVEFLNQIKLLLNDLDVFVDNLKDEEVHYKMTRYLFILNAVKEIRPYLEIIESGRKCDQEVKELLYFILDAVKKNNRKDYNKGVRDLKDYFIT